MLSCLRESVLERGAESGFRETEAVPDVRGGERLEAFCQRVERMFESGIWRALSTESFVELIAEEFRRFYCLTTPVAPRLGRLLRELDVEQATSYRETRFDFDTLTGQWLVCLPEETGTRTAVHLLTGLFEILFWRCWYRVWWWRDWRRAWGITAPRRLAERFAYFVVMPPKELREKAQQSGLNPWKLSDDFQATASACFYGLRRYARFPFPYFLARLNFHFRLDQQKLLFAENAVRAEVWAKFLAKPVGDYSGRPSPLDPLTAFPRKGSVLEASGFLCQSLKERRSLLVTTDRLLDLHFRQPVCFAARPNSYGTQLFLQAVPHECRAFLMDDALWAQKTEIRLDSAVEK